MLFNLSDDQLAKYKQERFSIWFLAITHLLYSYRFPMYVRFGEPWCSIMWLALSALSFVAFVKLFSSAHIYVQYFDSEIGDSLPYGFLAKKIAHIALAVIGITTMYYLWRIDYYHMPKLDYMLLYGHMILTGILFYRAMYREVIV